jgi:hypothetical protein
MATFGDLKGEIATDLRRGNLGSEIATAVLDAIRDHESERFWFNQTDTAITATLVVGTVDGTNDIVTPANMGLPSSVAREFIKIDKIRSRVAADNTSNWYTLKQTDWHTIEYLYSIKTSGQPAWWAYGTGPNQNVRIFPFPSAAYPLRFFGHFRLPLLVNDTDSNNWTNEAKNLIRYTALRRLFAYPIRNPDEMQSATAAAQGELDYLRRESERRVRIGQMRAYYG